MTDRMSDERLAHLESKDWFEYGSYAQEFLAALRAERTAYERLAAAIFRGFAQMDESDQIPMYGEVMPILEAHRTDSPEGVVNP